MTVSNKEDVTTNYPGDLTDKEWEIIEALLPKAPRNAGRKPYHSKRQMLNAIFYILRTGCQWRMLPHDFPPWHAVYSQYRRWKNMGFFELIHDSLRTSLRQVLGKNAFSSVGIVDSQSVKTTEKRALQDSMRVRKLKVENDIYWWIAWDLSKGRR